MAAPGTKPQRARRAQSPAAPGPTAADLSVLALQLLGRWQRVCNGHVSFANGCACVFGAAVELNDFDDLILDYLRNKFPGQAAVAAYIDGASVAAAGAAPSLKALLRKVAAAPAEVPLAQAEGLLRALETSIASIEEQHVK